MRKLRRGWIRKLAYLGSHTVDSNAMEACVGMLAVIMKLVSQVEFVTHNILKHQKTARITRYVKRLVLRVLSS